MQMNGWNVLRFDTGLYSFRQVLSDVSVYKGPLVSAFTMTLMPFRKIVVLAKQQRRDKTVTVRSSNIWRSHKGVFNISI